MADWKEIVGAYRDLKKKDKLEEREKEIRLGADKQF